MAGRGGFTIGGVFRRMALLLDRHGGPLGVAALVMVGLPALLTVSHPLAGHMTEAPAAVPGAGPSSWVSLALLLRLVVQALFDGFVIATAFADMRGEPPNVPAALRAALRALVPLILLELLGILAITLGFLLLVVPGLMLSCAWVVARPAYMAEEPGLFGAFGRSRRLTAGHRWTLFGLGVLYAVTVAAGAFLGLLLVDNLLPGGFAWLAAPLGSAALALGTAIGTVAIYIELRLVEDGPAPA